MLQRYGVQHHRSSAYRPQTNGAVEAANKNIKRILRKMVETSRDWSEKLPFALWAYRTSFRTSTGATPYSLVYGMEGVLPVEIEMGSLRVRATPTGVAIRGAITVTAKMAPKSPKTMLQWRWHRRWRNVIGDVGVPYLVTLERNPGGCKRAVDSSCASQRLSQRLYFI